MRRVIRQSADISRVTAEHLYARHERNCMSLRHELAQGRGPVAVRVELLLTETSKTGGDTVQYGTWILVVHTVNTGL